MKKNVRRILAICLMVALLFSMTTLATNVTAEDEARILEIRLTNQSNASQYYKDIVDSFGLAENEIVYPDYYGGAYVDDLGNLVIAVCGDTENARGKILKTAKNSAIFRENANTLNAISFVAVENSFTDLKNAQEEFRNLMITVFSDKEQYPDIRGTVLSTALDEINNCVQVRISEWNQTVIDTIKAFSSYPDVLHFVIPEISSSSVSSDKDISQQISNNNTRLTDPYVLQPGEKVCVGDIYSGYSFGFRCKKLINNNWVYGFVTSAHGTSDGELVMNSSNTVIGEVYNSSYENQVDASFVATDSSVTLSSIGDFSQNNILPSAVPTVGPTLSLQNSIIYKEGFAGYLQYGSILSTSTDTYTEYDRYLYNLLELEYIVSPGDSGGIVYTYDNGQWTIVGIVVGRAGLYPETHPTSSLACYASYIIPALGVTPY